MTALPPIIFSENAFQDIGRYLKKKNARGALFTDPSLAKIFHQELAVLRRKSSVEIFPFPANEKTKSLPTIEKLAAILQEHSFERKNTVILAFGGGIVGDIVGFLSSVYLRGVPYLQIPTTLLAMVDSAIGGKTGVNTKYGKNMLGSFYHPAEVLIDISFLKKLPEKEIRNGLAEMVKHAVLDSHAHLQELEKNIPAILKRDAKTLRWVIEKSIRVKLRHVKGDEREQKNIRSFLNFGHTIGHAIEKASNYKIPHGQAISIGMVMETELAEKELGFTGKDELVRVLRKCGLPTELPQSIKKKDLSQFIQRDKKNIDRKLLCALPIDFGKFDIHHIDKYI